MLWEDDSMTQKEADPGGCPVMLRLKKQGNEGDLSGRILRDSDSHIVKCMGNI